MADAAPAVAIGQVDSEAVLRAEARPVRARQAIGRLEAVRRADHAVVRSRTSGYPICGGWLLWGTTALQVHGGKRAVWAAG